MEKLKSLAGLGLVSLLSACAATANYMPNLRASNFVREMQSEYGCVGVAHLKTDKYGNANTNTDDLARIDFLKECRNYDPLEHRKISVSAGLGIARDEEARVIVAFCDKGYDCNFQVKEFR